LSFLGNTRIMAYGWLAAGPRMSLQSDKIAPSARQGRLASRLNGVLQTSGDPTMMLALTALTDNRKRIAILALLSFIALC